MLAELTRSYVGAINTGGVPTISSAWDAVVKIEGAKALEAALALYEKRIGDAIRAEPIMEADAIKAAHEGALRAATELFRTKAIGENVRTFEDELNV